MTLKSRKKVLYYSPTIWSNTDFYRTTGVLPFINHPELILRDISHFGSISQWDLKGSDILIIQRPCSIDNLNFIKIAKSCGLKIIIDADDDTLNVDFYNPTYIQYQQQREVILKCIELADEVWVSTYSIKKSFGRGVVIPNALNNHLLGECADFNYKSNKIVWRGGSTHEADMYENADTIVDMVNNHPELDFYFIGHRFTYLEQRCGDNYTSVDGMNITTYFEYLKQLKPLAMIFPLRDTLLNRAKSIISWMEATWSGAAYFGNSFLPEYGRIGGVLELKNIEKNIVDKYSQAFAHSSSKSEIQNNLTLDKINQLRINSLLNL